jgi:hypothetical protein
LRVFFIILLSWFYVLNAEAQLSPGDPDCHSDYHNKQFEKNGVSPDCSSCHTVKGFTNFSYTIEQHNQGVFPLRGAHEATPCNECHMKQEKWKFKEIGIFCKDCHSDIHKDIISSKYYPEAKCETCHNENRWNDVSFIHFRTGFVLTGVHANTKCRSCHYKTDKNGIPQQRFSGLDKNCSECHNDEHYGQFEKSGRTYCEKCHNTKSWKASLFNHDNAEFKLEGKHIDVPCIKCHESVQEGTKHYVKYKLKEFKCESCHL